MKLNIAQIVLEQASFEHQPDFLQRKPTEALAPSEIALRVELAKQEAADGAVVRLLVESPKETAYRFKVSYLVLFTFAPDGEEVPDDLDRRLMVTGAAMAFPFAREFVANLTSRGRFGTTWLGPTDFSRLTPTPKAPAEVATGVE